MDVSVFCNSKSPLNCLCVLQTRTRPRWATPSPLQHAGTVLLLLSFLSFSSCLGKVTLSGDARYNTPWSLPSGKLTDGLPSFFTEEDCELGIVGHPVSLPCFYPELSTFKKVSVEWRREGEVVLRSVWGGDRNVEEWSVNNATISADALLTGNLSLELPTFDLKEDRTVYSLFLSSGENQSSLLCAVCLKTAGQCQTHRKETKEYLIDLTGACDVCLQPVSAPRCCTGNKPMDRRPTSVAPVAVSLSLQFTGSSMTPRSPLKAQWGPWQRRTQTPTCTTSQATWQSTTTTCPACPAS